MAVTSRSRSAGTSDALPGSSTDARPIDDGAFWTGTQAGDTIRVWIVDVGETRLYIEGATRADAGVDLERELEHIVGSIRFE